MNVRAEGSDTGATPKTSAAPVTKKFSPMYSPEIQGWDFSWLEILEWLEEGGSLAMYFRRIRRADVFGWAARFGPGMRALT